jgi:uncharacterized protein (TIGR00299 family) protein
MRYNESMTKQQILFVDAFSGASGDMLLGALLDAGLPLAALQAELDKLNLAGYELEAERRESHGLTGIQLHVRDTLGEYPARHLHDIQHLILDSTLSEQVKRASMDVIERLARVEAGIHGVSLEEVHFHEIGAVDTIVDVVGFCAGLEMLGIEQLYASPIPLGSGTVDIAHGRLPVPVPATLALLASVNAPTVPHPAQTEIVTPTGAALLSHFAIFERPAMRVLRIGYGFGSRPFPWANAIRVWVGERDLPSHYTHDQVIVIECNLDDMTGEMLGYTMERLFEAGALDVWFTPIQMKKNRPGVLLSALSPMDQVDALSQVLLHETSTLGVRMYPPAHRFKAERRVRGVETPWGMVRIKEKWMGGQRLAVSPEYEDCARLARESGEPLVRIMEAARQAGEA